MFFGLEMDMNTLHVYVGYNNSLLLNQDKPPALFIFLGTTLSKRIIFCNLSIHYKCEIQTKLPMTQT